MRQATIDLVFFHVVLQYTVDLEDTYQAYAPSLAVGRFTRLISPRVTRRKYGMTIRPTQTGYGRLSRASSPFISIGNRAHTISNYYTPAGLRSWTTGPGHERRDQAFSTRPALERPVRR